MVVNHNTIIATYLLVAHNRRHQSVADIFSLLFLGFGKNHHTGAVPEQKGVKEVARIY
jgi:hypothetical protein